MVIINEAKILILVDFNQVVISSVTADSSNRGKGGQKIVIEPEFMRHSAINTLRYYRSKFKREFGELVICCDSNEGYWRKQFCRYYKSTRSKAKDDSPFDWRSISNGLSLVQDELRTHFPYPVIDVAGAEGDDIIATLCEWSQTNDLTQDGIFSDEPSPLLILSGDGDQIQNQKYKNVHQYSPMKKMWLKPDGKSVREFLNEHIAEGDRTDGIVNVLSPENCFEDKIRQKSLKKERREEFIKHGIGACLNEEEKKNYVRNQTLIDFSFIPFDLKQQITNEFENELEAAKKRGRRGIMTYFVKNRMRMLLDCIQDF